MTAMVYDAGALVAADRGERRLWRRHRALLERGSPPVVPTPVVAQVSRSPRQAQLRRLLQGSDVVALHEQQAHDVGAVLAASGTTDIADATVVTLARARRAAIMTSDRGGMERLVGAVGEHLPVIDC